MFHASQRRCTNRSLRGNEGNRAMFPGDISEIRNGGVPRQSSTTAITLAIAGRISKTRYRALCNVTQPVPRFFRSPSARFSSQLQFLPPATPSTVVSPRLQWPIPTFTINHSSPATSHDYYLPRPPFVTSANSKRKKPLLPALAFPSDSWYVYSRTGDDCFINVCWIKLRTIQLGTCSMFILRTSFAAYN